MNALFVLFTAIKLSNAIKYNLKFNANGDPINVDRQLNAGDSITIDYKDRETFVVIIDSPKFYLDVNLSSNFRAFHSTEPALYAVGNGGTLRYTALEKGTHKFVVWYFQEAKCKYVVAKGQQYYMKDIAITPNRWAFIQTDSSVKMKVKSTGLKTGKFVFFYNGEKTDTYSNSYGSFEFDVNVPVVLQVTNPKDVIEVDISSNGNEKYNYGEYGMDDLKVSAVPFYFKSQGNKKDMNNGLYQGEQPPVQEETKNDPPQEETKNDPPVEETKNDPPQQESGNEVEKPETGGDELKGKSEEATQLTTSEKAGIAAGSVGGVGAIGGAIGGGVKAFFKYRNSRRSEDEDEDEPKSKSKSKAEAESITVQQTIYNYNNIYGTNGNNPTPGVVEL